MVKKGQTIYSRKRVIVGGLLVKAERKRFGTSLGEQETKWRTLSREGKPFKRAIRKTAKIREYENKLYSKLSRMSQAKLLALKKIPKVKR